MLLLDSSIRDWILIPLTLIILMVPFLRSVLLQYVKSRSPVAGETVQQKNLVARSQRLRQHGGYISELSYLRRKHYLIGSNGERLLNKSEEDAFVSPFAMMDQMKSQLIMMVSNMGVGYLIQLCFTGFVIVKLPFSLTSRFKQMTQQGMRLPMLEASFVSSFSWYLLTIYAARPLVQVLLGSQHGGDEAEMMQQQMGMMMGGASQTQQFNVQKAYKAEAKSLKLARRGPSKVDQSERTLLQRWDRGQWLHEPSSTTATTSGA